MKLTDFTMDFFSLEGQTALVTGGNSGLGRAFSVALAEAGADVFIASLTEDDGTTRELIESKGSRMEFMQVNITEDGAAKRTIEQCVETMGSLDIVVNSAGLNKVAGFDEFGRDKWDPLIQVNLTAAFEISHEAAKVMIPKKRGKIINICSVFSFHGGSGSPAYAASKHGVAGLTKAYCDELAGYNIQVNGIAPGYYATELTQETRNNPETNQKVLDHTPANRWGEPMDLMGAVVFLASRASDYVNGHIVAVDGGYLVR
ncbi:SDR family oxidoreductase [Halobacillus sp. K22]|uniref:SDR family oxidoreductase n=1 Tax=Halobacillus sp. K22 TaxID=3457431 RepID=UPI003FCE7064